MRYRSPISHRIETRRALLTVLVTVAVVALFVQPITGSGARSFSPARIDKEVAEALELARLNYAGGLDTVASMQTAMEGMLRALDPHSSYLDPIEYADLRREQESQFYGIGVTINRRNGRVYVLSVVPGTPAARVGLRYGDAIRSVDKQPASDWSTQEVARHVRGERDTSVELVIDRLGEPKPLEYKIRRGPVPLPSIRNTFMIRPGLGYVGLTGGFQNTTNDELSDRIDELKDSGLKGLVLDLRNNPGGLLDQAIEVASRFLKPGEVVLSIRGRKNERPPFRARGGSNVDFPLIVLINRNTASASEIVAGALQDHDRGLIVGEPSFGKGLVQTVYPIMRGSGGALALTTARYYTPSGRSIQRSYDGISAFEYFTRRAEKTTGAAAHTDAGRVVYGGGGIEPDIVIAPSDDLVRVRIFGGVFDFTRHLVAGIVPGFTEYRVDRAEQPRNSSAIEFEVSDRLLSAFRQFILEHKEFGVRESDLDTQAQFVRDRLQQELVTARHGVDAGYRAFLLHDPQTLKAIESFPEAKQLVENLRHAPHRF